MESAATSANGNKLTNRASINSSSSSSSSSSNSSSVKRDGGGRVNPAFEKDEEHVPVDQTYYADELISIPDLDQVL